MLNLSRQLRRLSTAIRQSIEDEGDWFYSSEWWGSISDGHTVFRSTSDKGNGVVSDVAYPSSRPVHVASFHIISSTDVKSMVSAGLVTIASCKFDLESAVCGRKPMKILCIGHGGGSIPLFLTSKIQGLQILSIVIETLGALVPKLASACAEVHIAEIDPVVISASVQAMGFPSYSVMTPSGSRAHSTPDPIEEVQWKGIHERLQLHESDAEKFLLENKNLYDLVFIDAYDGEDIFPHALWDTHSPFLNALADQLHPEHGTVVVNLHSDVDFRDTDFCPPGSHLLPMGKYVSKVCRAYEEVLLGSRSSYNGLAYVVSVPWVCNTSLVVCRGLEKSSGDMVMKTMMSRALVVENILDLPFSCLQYLKRGFTFVN
ncbi:hypothetical protein RND71_040147 [Anisodus tanguticus]|uniref:Uncharacterized protein n=1 Tax=Anisodus tanguticus TaxID=243964 RepID=A0AAE1QY60_9SOLA|nr:hypothetical protein RND71_040147 [Anisodus tanguticus]